MEIKGYDNLVFFDTETTGFDAEKNKIIELAAISVTPDGEEKMDEFIRLPDGEFVPDNIVKLTGITNEMLADGKPEEEAAGMFYSLISRGEKTLLIAHNAQFDINFAAFMFIRQMKNFMEYMAAFNKADYLDTLTVFKDRRPYPHKLANAIEVYGLGDKVENTHRAIDDTKALYEVTKALQEERDDLEEYINVFGFNPKYGVSGRAFKKIIYHVQPYRNNIAPPEGILPAIIKKGAASIS